MTDASLLVEKPARPLGRDQIVDYLRAHVVGPADGVNELLQDLPHKRYLMGVLYAQGSTTDEMLATEEIDGNGAVGREETPEDPVTLANAWMPSSIGLTFFVIDSPTLRVAVWAARYEAAEAGPGQWRRVPIAEESAPDTVEVSAPTEGEWVSTPVLEGRAHVHTLWRPFRAGFLVTASLVNSQREPESDKVSPGLCLLQVGLECAVKDGEIREYPSVAFLSRDPEDEELRLLHRHAKVFAIGHGCAADWRLEGTVAAETVRTEVLPSYVVPALTQSGPGEQEVLRLRRLADPSVHPDALRHDLHGLIDFYKEWIDGLPARNTDIPPALHDARDRVMSRLNAVEQRLRRGADVITGDPIILRAFRLANLAMLMQMHHSSEEVGGTRKPREIAPPPSADYMAMEYAWYPFQLAFQLLTLPSIALPDEFATDREAVDLLWFPTGGGKTEAYLAVAAFQIFLRRLRSGDRGAGTAVITRYTLRLLTAQQFQRASVLICACELLRSTMESEMGRLPITIGLWVGEGVSPNSYQDARAAREEMLEEPDPENQFQLEQCPWCGTEIVPERRVDDETAYGVRADNASFALFCPNQACVFHARLPVLVVDQHLYDQPPAMLLATVDKFARLAWEDRGGAFFGQSDFEPPSLIIQDEMHLLSGPLGTTVAVYEGAVEGLIEFYGPRPKIIASTATIRKADDQSLGLFGREVRIFPPPGLSSSDSFYARIDENRAGRRYVGVMSHAHTPHTTIVHVAAALLQAPIELRLPPAEVDAYWSLVAYHNSLRELGRTATFARDDVPSRLESLAADQSRQREISFDSVVELTGNVGGTELPRILARLFKPAGDPEAVSFLATTNMLSVGVDVSRLGLMFVLGQPKSTAEYIQASSRVGRSSKRPPGLVVTMYVSTKPRDRSHYESFRPYHSAFYKHVEPTSVTPFSLPSRERALHAALVILVRHGVGLSRNDAAGLFDRNDAKVRRAIEVLLARVARVDPRECKATEAHLNARISEWERAAAAAAAEGKALYYRASTRQHHALLRDFDAPGEGWKTLNSMRNVDRQSRVTVLGE